MQPDDQPPVVQSMTPMGAALRAYVDLLVQRRLAGDSAALADLAAVPGPATQADTAVCPRCRNAHYLVADAHVGDPAFGKLIRCTCAPPTRRRDLTAVIQATLGTRTGCTLASFDLREPAASRRA